MHAAQRTAWREGREPPGKSHQQAALSCGGRTTRKLSEAYEKRAQWDHGDHLELHFRRCYRGGSPSRLSLSRGPFFGPRSSTILAGQKVVLVVMAEARRPSKEWSQQNLELCLVLAAGLPVALHPLT